MKKARAEGQGGSPEDVNCERGFGCGHQQRVQEGKSRDGKRGRGCRVGNRLAAPVVGGTRDEVPRWAMTKIQRACPWLGGIASDVHNDETTISRFQAGEAVRSERGIEGSWEAPVTRLVNHARVECGNKGQRQRITNDLRGCVASWGRILPHRTWMSSATEKRESSSTLLR